MLRCFSRLQASCVSAVANSRTASATSGAGASSSSGGLFASLSAVVKRWATSKAGGVTKNGRKAQPKYLGLKKTGNERVLPGHILIRQRGQEFRPGRGVGMGRDHTLYALIPGVVRFTKNSITGKRWINVVSQKEHDEMAGIIARDRARRNAKWRGILRPGDKPEIITTV